MPNMVERTVSGQRTETGAVPVQMNTMRTWAPGVAGNILECSNKAPGLARRESDFLNSHALRKYLSLEHIREKKKERE